MQANKWLAVAIPFATRVMYFVFSVCALLANTESHQIFEGVPRSEGSTVFTPVKFCTYDMQVEAQNAETTTTATNAKCMDLHWVAVMVPVANILSIVSVIVYSLMDALLRYRRTQRWGTPFTSGLTAGLGFALLIILIQTACVCFAIATIAHYYGQLYGGVDSYRGYSGHDTSVTVDEIRLTGSPLVIYVAGGFACAAALLTIADASLLVSGHESHHTRGLATGVVIAPPAASIRNAGPTAPPAAANERTHGSSWICGRSSKTSTPSVGKAQDGRSNPIPGAAVPAVGNPRPTGTASVANPFFNKENETNV